MSQNGVRLKGRIINTVILATVKGVEVERCPETGIPITLGDSDLVFPCWAEFVADRARELNKRPVADERITELRGNFFEDTIGPATQLIYLYDSGLHPFYFETAPGIYLFSEAEVQPLGSPSLINVRARLGIPFVVRGRSQMQTVTQDQLPPNVLEVFTGGLN